jgi:SAM-dependent methyltransferase
MRRKDRGPSPESHKSLVAKSYDDYVLAYSERSEMQTQNLLNLLQYARSQCVSIAGKILDVGCGCGAAGRLLLAGYPARIEYAGVDLSAGMLAQATRLLPRAGTLLHADAERLPFENASFDFVLSNSVYHWLNAPEIGLTPELAWSEAYRVLKKGGYLLFSIAGRGTARVFQACYRQLAERFRGSHDFYEHLYRDDPLGCMGLDEVERMLSNVGYTIIYSTHDYEPLLFGDAAGYVDAVEAYGYEMYLEAFTDEMKPSVWRQIRNEFVKSVGPGAYTQDQFMIYVIAKK